MLQSLPILRPNPFCLPVLAKHLCIKSACNLVPMSRLTSVILNHWIRESKWCLFIVLCEFQNGNYRASINLHWIISNITTSPMHEYFQGSQMYKYLKDMQPTFRTELISHCLLKLWHPWNEIRQQIPRSCE